jgi:hypothetical protein
MGIHVRAVRPVDCHVLAPSEELTIRAVPGADIEDAGPRRESLRESSHGAENGLALQRCLVDERKERAREASPDLTSVDHRDMLMVRFLPGGNPARQSAYLR